MYITPTFVTIVCVNPDDNRCTLSASSAYSMPPTLPSSPSLRMLPPHPPLPSAVRPHQDARGRPGYPRLYYNAVLSAVLVELGYSWSREVPLRWSTGQLCELNSTCANWSWSGRVHPTLNYDNARFICAVLSGRYTPFVQ